MLREITCSVYFCEKLPKVAQKNLENDDIVTLVNIRYHLETHNLTVQNLWTRCTAMSTTPRFTAFVAGLLRPSLTSSSASQLGLTVLRVVAGLVMIHNGLDKLSDIPGFAEAYVRVIGLPFPIFFSYCAAYTELIAAPLLALGLFARPAAAGLFGTMGVAMYHHILVAGFSIPYLELSMLYAACFLFFALNGAGLFSADNLLSKMLSSSLRGALVQEATSLEQSYKSLEKASK
jgi:putative oxidoreductase